MMKKTIALFLAACAVTLAYSQTTADDYRAAFERQVNSVGLTGLGVRTMLDSWEAAYPDDVQMLEYKHMFYLAKSRTTKVMAKPLRRFLGNAPVMTLKDSKTGENVNYFEEIMYDDDLFAKAESYLDKAIKLSPREFRLRIDLLSSLLEYEKECPDMLTMEMLNLIREYVYDSRKKEWTCDSQAVDDDFFPSMVQEYCVSLFSTASPGSYEAFRAISDAMMEHYPSKTVFISNVGSYYLVAVKSDRKALAYYKKVLKMDPKDYSAARNCVLIARNSKNARMEKKYLPYLIEATDSETERQSCQARLTALSSSQKGRP